MYFYNARYYDPALGRFISPDTIIPNPANPQSLNRYSYCLNNPVKYTDPSGHIAQNELDAANNYLTQLVAYDVEIHIDWGWAGPFWARKWEAGLWTLAELDTVLQAVQGLAGAMGGDAAFRSNLGGVKIKQRSMRSGGRGRAHHVTLNEAGFDEWTVVHELGHAWDGANGWRLSRDMQKAVGAGYDHPGRHLLDPSDPAYWYDPGQGPPPCGIDANFNRFEDFAEAVAAYVYPKAAQQRATKRNWPYTNTVRGYSYADFSATPRGQHIQALMVTPP